MKRILPIILLCALFVACSNDDGYVRSESVTKIELSQTHIELNQENLFATVKVMQGAGGYRIDWSDKKPVMIGQPFDDKSTIFIAAINMGECIITVTDKNGNKEEITVSVTSAVEPKRETIYIVKGDTKTLDYPKGVEMITGASTETGISTYFINEEKKIMITGYEVGKSTFSLGIAEWSDYFYVYDVEVCEPVS